MQTIEITDPVEARRCHRAQYRGEKATVILNGLPVSGLVRSVMEVNGRIQDDPGAFVPTIGWRFPQLKSAHTVRTLAVCSHFVLIAVNRSEERRWSPTTMSRRSSSP